MKEKCPKFIKKVLELMLKHWWYVFLLIISSIYVFIYRNDISQLTELNAQNLIFILWLFFSIFFFFSIFLNPRKSHWLILI